MIINNNKKHNICKYQQPKGTISDGIRALGGGVVYTYIFMPC